jgi:hypothetical protein
MEAKKILTSLPKDLTEKLNSFQQIKKIGKAHQVSKKRGTSYHDDLRMDILSVLYECFDK